MKTLFKAIAVSSVIQALLCVLLAFISYLFSPTTDFLFEWVIYLYSPTIYFVSKLGNFSGESNIFSPIILGIPFGIFLYGLIIGSIFTYFKRR